MFKSLCSKFFIWKFLKIKIQIKEVKIKKIKNFFEFFLINFFDFIFNNLIFLFLINNLRRLRDKNKKLFFIFFILFSIIFFGILYLFRQDILNIVKIICNSIIPYAKTISIILILIPIILNATVNYLFVIIQRKGQISIPLLNNYIVVNKIINYLKIIINY